MEPQLCVTCLSTAAQVQLLPCEHRALCAACTPQLQSAQCPLCRAPIHSVRLSPSLCVPFAPVLRQRRHFDQLLRARVATVLICSQRPAQRAVTALVATLCKLFPLPPDLPLLQLPPLLALTAYSSPAAPNALVNGVPVLFRHFALPETPHQLVITALHNCQPDFIFLSCLLHPRHSFHSMLQWDSPIRRACFPSVHPKRMWLYLTPSKHHPNFSPSLINPNLHFKEDLYNALNAIPLLHRPLTYHVIDPNSAWTRPVKRLAKRAVHHVLTSRPLTTSSPPTTTFT